MSYVPDIFCPVFPCVYRSCRGAHPGRSGRVRHGAAALAAGHCRAAAATPAAAEETGEIDARRFAAINQGAKQEVAAGHVPGAVILVGHRGKTVYRKAFGHARP